MKSQKKREEKRARRKQFSRKIRKLKRYEFVTEREKRKKGQVK